MSHLLHAIAIDGPAASGKSALAELLAARLNYFYLDTGLMYRAVTHAALARGMALQDETAVTRLAETIQINVLPGAASAARNYVTTVDGRDVSAELHRPEVDRNVSAVSAYAGVRRAMTAQQQRIAERGNIIMAGRDIGTVVLPDAECKIFLTASVEARARRRLADRRARGQSATLEQMRAEIEQRDALDSSRSVAPLRAAEDAIVLDNSAMTLEETLTRALEIIQARASVRIIA
ncbi:(d)CMP kinase [Anaerolineae bacterium CFX7]|nr:(d)CMP kinase [Anaerolineae bacterium CFX7]